MVDVLGGRPCTRSMNRRQQDGCEDRAAVRGWTGLGLWGQSMRVEDGSEFGFAWQERVGPSSPFVLQLTGRCHLFKMFILTKSISK
jgi:hypothetical protein